VRGLAGFCISQYEARCGGLREKSPGVKLPQKLSRQVLDMILVAKFRYGVCFLAWKGFHVRCELILRFKMFIWQRQLDVLFVRHFRGERGCKRPKPMLESFLVPAAGMSIE
jgi:hypothetical protein